MTILGSIEKLLKQRVNGRPAIDQMYSISDTQGFHLDYKGRKHLFIWSNAAITLSLGVLGSYSITQNVWTVLDFEADFKLFTSGTTNPVNVLIRATDEGVA